MIEVMGQEFEFGSGKRITVGAVFDSDRLVFTWADKLLRRICSRRESVQLVCSLIKYKRRLCSDAGVFYFDVNIDSLSPFNVNTVMSSTGSFVA